ncbi:hypothetical protein GGQ64_004327 [Rhizobium azooxidifex]|uniref:Uncharacterized protein n=1 Tax=Mycoplana azooxidifex TaxID=1636188 RepID=A0A7W6DD65_9HYPH|nr:hypothetical protein [Mycoplana azooxidifex]MBB3979091.1 hypothetical protein [Mycoplana azooxidifex]
MNQQDVSPAQKRMEAIRTRAARASRDWSVMADGQLCLMTGEGEAEAVVLRVTDEAPVDDREFVLHLPDDHFWLLDMYDRLAERHRKALAEIDRLSPKPKDFSAECAMKCAKDHAFRRFLEERHNLDTSDLERIKTRVRSILAIQSMTELNTDENARKRWLSLRAEFDQWRRAR